MGKKDTFKVGDFVFAKVKGYRPWPAKIVSVVSKKYSVYFYGTEEVGKNIKPQDIWPFKENKEKHSKNGALKQQFEDAIKQIELAIAGKDPMPKLEKVLEQLSTSVVSQKNDTLPSDPEPEDDGDKQDEEMAVEEKKQAEPIEEELVVKPPVKEVKKEPKKLAAGKKKAPVKVKEEIQVDQVPEVEAEPEIEEPEKPEEKKLEENTVSRGGRKIKKRGFEEEEPAAVAAKKPAVEKVKAEKQVADSTTNAKKATKQKAQQNDVSPESVLDNVDPRKKDLLIVECQMCASNHEIKMCLSLEKADTKKCLEYLEELKKIVPNATAFMLKKNPNCVETIKRLKRYVGNSTNWNLNPLELAEFQTNAGRIRKYAEEIYEIFKQKFDPTEERFYNAFTKIVADFEEKSKPLSEDVMAALCFDEELP